MADVKELKKRIKGVSNTKKITNAMKAMSMIRLQKAEARAVSAKPYAEAVKHMVSGIGEGGYFKHNKSSAVLLVVFSSDRGLCGGFNDTLLKSTKNTIEKHIKQGKKIKLILIGAKAVSFFSRSKFEVYSKYAHLPTEPTIHLSNLVVADCKKLFLEGTVSEVVVIYNHFLSKLKYDTRMHILLPLPQIGQIGKNMLPNFVYEPDKVVVLNSIMEMYLGSAMYQFFLESTASEYSARFASMSKATDNADEMITDLTLKLNKTRQAVITSEILEIVSGAEALRY